jgi:sugar phosphate isomerase/epimerase
MWTLSGFADEISPDLDEQCRVLTELGMSYLELRGAWNTNVADFDDDQVERVATRLAAAGIRVSSIGSPIGKVGVDEIESDLDGHVARFRRCAQVARRLEAAYVRVFSFYPRNPRDPTGDRDVVLRGMRALADAAAQESVVLLHENEKAIYGDVPERCLDIVESVDSPALRLTWDPANFVQCGVRPYTEGYASLRPYVEYLQIKDAIAATGTVVPAGEGDGEVAETLAALADDGFDGFFSLEPHLSRAHELGGFSGPQLFTEAHTAFTDLLREQGTPYR